MTRILVTLCAALALGQSAQPSTRPASSSGWLPIDTLYPMRRVPVPAYAFEGLDLNAPIIGYQLTADDIQRCVNHRIADQNACDMAEALTYQTWVSRYWNPTTMRWETVAWSERPP